MPYHGFTGADIVGAVAGAGQAAGYKVEAGAGYAFVTSRPSVKVSTTLNGGAVCLRMGGTEPGGGLPGWLRCGGGMETVLRKLLRQCVPL